MIPKKLLVLALLLSTSYSFSQSLINADLGLDLKINADAIVKYDDFSIRLIRQDMMIIQQKMAIEILNKKADYLAELTLSYDKKNLIKNVYMEFFDAAGKRIKKVKKNDFDDYSATDGGTLYSDDRIIHYNHTATSYPYTVVYEYELGISDTAFIPGWVAARNYNIGVVSSTYSFSCPASYKIQKLESNFDSFNVEKTEGVGLLQYKITNVPALKPETLSPSFKELIPRVKIASNKFHLAGVNGTADNWREMGKWIHNNLLASRNNLSPETIAKIKEMVKGVPEPIERAKIIYDYVQNKTRYISVQMEIGGWQPMLTNDVDKLGYGDCKALTYYTKSLLDIAEVPSFYTLVFASYGKSNIKKETVSQQGNHAILSLPMQKDTIWLECTSQKVPFGFINSSTDDRDVLVITPEGGKIVHTNFNKPEDNLQKTITSYSLSENGSIRGITEIESYGTQYEQHLDRYDGLSPDALQKSLKNHFDLLNNLHFSKIEVTNNKERKNYQENLEFTAEHYGIINSDASILFNLNALNRISHVPDRVRNRKTKFEILRGFKDVDTYTINIPENYSISEFPQDATINTQFGTYTMSVKKLTDNSLEYHRNILINKGLYEKELYEEYRAFRKKIRKKENIKIAIIKL